MKFVFETAMSLSLLLYLCSLLPADPIRQVASTNTARIFVLDKKVQNYAARIVVVKRFWELGPTESAAADLYSCFNIMIIIIYLYNSAVCMTVITLREWNLLK